MTEHFRYPGWHEENTISRSRLHHSAAFRGLTVLVQSKEVWKILGNLKLRPPWKSFWLQFTGSVCCSSRMRGRICITPETCNQWDNKVCIPCWERSQLGGLWHGQIPVLLFTERMSTSEKCPVVTTANSMAFHSSSSTPFLSSGGRKNTSLSFSHTVFPKSCLQLAAHFSCVYLTQCLLLYIFLLKDQAQTFSDDRYTLALLF